MTSRPNRAFVWIWLPGEGAPAPAGVLDRDGDVVAFTYGRSYLDNPRAVSVWPDELPLVLSTMYPERGEIAGCIDDAGPDAWGRRVMASRFAQEGETELDPDDPLVRLLYSGSGRIGGLDFQESPHEYAPRESDSASLDELVDSAKRVEEGIPLSPGLDLALMHGTSVGGARPKALVEDGGIAYVAKFSSSTDTYSVVRGEFIAMTLARRVGIQAAAVKMVIAAGKEVLLVERFDRESDGARRLIVSGLTVVGESEAAARYISYEELAEKIRLEFSDPVGDLRELFARMSFNVLVGNTDDHLRNHAAIWDGVAPVLSPAYDICPQARTGGEASQAMAITREGARLSQLSNCLKAAKSFGLSEADARQIIDAQVDVIESNWIAVGDEAGLTTAERSFFYKRQFLNPAVFYGY